LTKKKAAPASGRKPPAAPRDPSTVDIAGLREVIQLMADNQLSELEVRQQGVHIRLSKGCSEAHLHTPGAPPSAGAAHPQSHAHAAHGAPLAKPHANAAAELAANSAQPGTVAITSPMVGTFYRSPAPDADPFIQVADVVDEESVVGIIEAMKVMNEIKAEIAGEVVQVLVESGEIVEYGQPIMLVRPPGA